MNARRLRGALTDWLDTLLIALATGLVAGVIFGLAALALSWSDAAEEPVAAAAVRNER